MFTRKTSAFYAVLIAVASMAVGMVIASRLSERVCGLPAREVERVIALVAACGLPTAPPTIPRERWLDLMGHDKKVAEGAIRFVLLDALGRASVRTRIKSEDLAAIF